MERISPALTCVLPERASATCSDREGNATRRRRVALPPLRGPRSTATGVAASPGNLQALVLFQSFNPLCLIRISFNCLKWHRLLVPPEAKNNLVAGQATRASRAAADRSATILVL